MYFENELAEHADKNLSEQDWEILEGLEEVLEVSHLFDSDPTTGTHRGDRSLTTFSNACHLNPCLCCRAQSLSSRNL